MTTVIRLIGTLDEVGVAIDVEISLHVLALEGPYRAVVKGQVVHAHSAAGECWKAEEPAEAYPYEPSYRELVARHAEGA